MPFMNKTDVCILCDALQFNTINITFRKTVIVIILSVFLGGSNGCQNFEFQSPRELDL